MAVIGNLALTLTKVNATVAESALMMTNSGVLQTGTYVVPANAVADIIAFNISLGANGVVIRGSVTGMSASLSPQLVNPGNNSFVQVLNIPAGTTLYYALAAGGVNLAGFNIGLRYGG